MPISGIGAARVEGWQHAVAAGAVAGHEPVLKFGRNPSVAAGVAEDVSDLGGDFHFPTTGGVVSVVSDSIEDDPSGTGQWQITIEGIATADGTKLSETIALDGTTPALTSGSFIRINRMYCPDNQAGSAGMNVGAITASIGGTDVSAILPGDSQTEQAVYTVPAGFRAFVSAWYFSMNKLSPGAGEPQANFSLFIRNNGTSPNGVWRLQRFIGIALTGGVPARMRFEYPLVYGPLTDIKVRCTDTTDISDVSAGFDLVLEAI
jgi:hypothetical protein